LSTITKAEQVKNEHKNLAGGCSLQLWWKR
jgi:hypothetical protein